MPRGWVSMGVCVLYLPSFSERRVTCVARVGSLRPLKRLPRTPTQLHPQLPPITAPAPASTRTLHPVLSVTIAAGCRIVSNDALTIRALQTTL